MNEQDDILDVQFRLENRSAETIPVSDLAFIYFFFEASDQEPVFVEPVPSPGNLEVADFEAQFLFVNSDEWGVAVTFPNATYELAGAGSDTGDIHVDVVMAKGTKRSCTEQISHGRARTISSRLAMRTGTTRALSSAGTSTAAGLRSGETHIRNIRIHAVICSRRRRGLLSTSGHIQALAITGILAACSPTLPSETPLGRGPAAEKEKPERIETGDKRAPEGGATAKTEPSLSSHPAARPAPAPKPATAKPSATPGQTKRADERSIFFAGQYSGLYDAIIALQGHPEKKRIDPKAKIRVERVSDTRARLVLLESETENLYCTLDVEVSANQGTISTGQSWSGPPALGEITGNIITGTARVDARRLLVDLTADIEANVVGDRIGGRLKFHFHGWRPLE